MCWKAKENHDLSSRSASTKGTPPDQPQLEPRGGLWVAIEAEGAEIQFINTHLGLKRKEREVQAEALLG